MWSSALDTLRNFKWNLGQPALEVHHRVIFYILKKYKHIGSSIKLINLVNFWKSCFTINTKTVKEKFQKQVFKSYFMIYFKTNTSSCAEWHTTTSPYTIRVSRVYAWLVQIFSCFEVWKKNSTLRKLHIVGLTYSFFYFFFLNIVLQLCVQMCYEVFKFAEFFNQIWNSKHLRAGN